MEGNINITRESGGLRLEACNNGGFSFGNPLFLFTQSIFSGMESVSKISNTRSFSFSFFASFLAGLEFLL